MKKIKKNKLIFIVFAPLMLGVLMLSPFFSINSNNVSNSQSLASFELLSENNSRALSTNLKILNAGDYLDDPGKNNSIVDAYNRKPSEIQEMQIKNIIDIINPNIQDTIQNPIKYTNLSHHPRNSSLTPDKPLECFVGINATLLTPNYLDENGLLAFKVEMTNNNNVRFVEYYLISGFNSRIINKTLPGIVYQDSVADLDNATLETFIAFYPKSSPNGYVTPNKKTLVPNTRVQDPSNGTISFSLELTYDVPEANFVISEVDPAIMTAQYRIETKFQTGLAYSGFQPSGNLSTKELYELIGIILGVGVGCVLIAISLALIIKKIKSKNAL